MKQYDRKCPICGALNRHLLLEDSEGWMECEKCGSTTRDVNFQNEKQIPCYSMQKPTEIRRTAS